jgi:hypothetical protein
MSIVHVTHTSDTTPHHTTPHHTTPTLTHSSHAQSAVVSNSEISPYAEGRHVITPNLAALADQSVVFERAYVSVALCMPSRTALLTSRRPDTSKSWTIEPDQFWRISGGNFTTLPQV